MRNNMKKKLASIVTFGILTIAAMLMITSAGIRGEDFCTSTVPWHLDESTGEMIYRDIKTPCELGDIGKTPLTPLLWTGDMVYIGHLDDNGEIFIVVLVEFPTDDPNDGIIHGFMYEGGDFLYDSKGNPIEVSENVMLEFLEKYIDYDEGTSI